MPENAAPPLDLAREFPPVSTEEWEAAIRADLAGADYDKKLLWRTDEGITVRPYYRDGDATPLGLDPSSLRAWEMVENPEFPLDAVRADWFHEAGATAIQELGWAMSWAVDLLAGNAAAPLVLVFATGSNYFFEIAKLRAARALLRQVTAAFPSPPAVRLHALTALSNKCLYDPYTNLLRATTEALAAALGGADAITVRPARFSDHLARSVHRILKEESHIGAVADAAAGSYYVEWLSGEFASRAWRLFQSVEAQGGYRALLEAGVIASELAAQQEARKKAVASRRRILVGVNNYPDLKETALGQQPPPKPDTGPFPPLRLAEEIEQIRLRTERHQRPTVLLLKRGDLKMKMARANFCANFFGCGGFAIREAEELEPAALVVLCSSDAEYLEFARDICPRAAAPVLVAGNPKDQIEALQQAGVAGFVHVQSNLVETLRHWQQALGMEN
jgi:methylmalonyl-CoA mutase